MRPLDTGDLRVLVSRLDHSRDGQTRYRRLMADPGPGTPQSWTSAAAAGLVYVSDAMPGIRRIRPRKTFSYLLPGGRKVTAAAEGERMPRLPVPPAYQDARTCPTTR